MHSTQPLSLPGQQRIGPARSLLRGVFAVLVAWLAAPEPAAPLFPPLGVHAENVSVLMTGAALAPQTGPLGTAATLLAGTEPQFRVWDLWGPLSSRPGRIQLGAATLTLDGFASTASLPQGLLQVAILQAGNDRAEGDGCWTLIDTDTVRPFPRAFRDGRIEDGKGLSIGTLETEAFAEMLVQSHYTSARAFAAAARRDLTYAQVFAEPATYRGQVMHIQGRLGRLSRLDPPPLAQAQGVSDLYEAWIFHDAYGLNPFCALFTELPPALRDCLGEKQLPQRDIEVAFDGYFYKKFRYKAADSKANTARDAPVFMGRTLQVLRLPAAAPEPDEWGNHVIGVFVGAVAVVIVAGITLTWWFRHSDSRVHRRLRAARETSVVLPDPLPPDSTAIAGDERHRNGRSEEFLGPMG